MTDRLVERIPVYLSQEFAKSLHLVKSPLRDPTRPYDDIGPLQNVSYKPTAHVIEFQYGLNQQDAHYNSNAEHRIDSISFVTRPTESRANHVIGQRLDNAFILYPITKVHQLLPVFTHVDAIQNEYDNDLLGAADDEDQTIRQAQLRVKKPDQIGRVKRITYDTIKEQINDDKSQHCTPIYSSADEIFNGNITFPTLPQEYMEGLKLKNEEQLRLRIWSSLPLKDRPRDLSEIDISEYESNFPLQEEAQVPVLQNSKARAQRRFTAQRLEMYKSKLLHPASENKVLTSAPIGVPLNTSESRMTNENQRNQKHQPQLASYIAPFVMTVPPSQSGSTAKDPADVRHQITLSTTKAKGTTPEAVLQYMQFARVASFEAIATNLEVVGYDALMHLLKILDSICYIVHGIFILQSTFVFRPDATRSTEQPQQTPRNKLSILSHVQRLVIIRHFILHSFAQASVNPKDPKSRPTISQAEISKIVDLNARDLLSLLQELGMKCVDKSLKMYAPVTNPEDGSYDYVDDNGNALWEFIQPPDYGFQTTFPEHCRASATRLADYAAKYFPQSQ